MEKTCGRCGAQNPDGSRFCNSCGAPLDAAYQTIKDFVDSTLRDRVREIIATEYRDQNVVQVETAQAITSKLSDWAKLFGFFVGIPVAVFLLILAFLGISTYSDFVRKIENAQKEATAKLNEAQDRAGKLKNDGDKLAGDYEKLRARYQDTEELADRLEKLSKKVDVIGEKLGFTDASNVSPEVKGKLEEAFSKFQSYLQSVGYRPSAGQIQIHVPERMDVVGAIAYYDPDKKMMVIDPKYVQYPVNIYREYMHHVLYASGMPDDPGAKLWAYYAIESGLAQYFPSSFLNDPKPASSDWDLRNDKSFKLLRPDIGSAMTVGTEIWAGAFWEIRQALGQTAADKLLFSAWLALKPEDALAQGSASFVAKILQLDGAHEAQIRPIFTRRGLSIPHP